VDTLLGMLIKTYTLLVSGSAFNNKLVKRRSRYFELLSKGNIKKNKNLNLRGKSYRNRRRRRRSNKVGSGGSDGDNRSSGGYVYNAFFFIQVSNCNDIILTNFDFL